MACRKLIQEREMGQQEISEAVKSFKVSKWGRKENATINAMHINAESYREPSFMTTEFSRRGRGEH